MFPRSEIFGRKRILVDEIMGRLEKTHPPESETHKRVRKALLKKFSYMEVDSLWVLTLTSCKEPNTEA